MIFKLCSRASVSLFLNCEFFLDAPHLMLIHTHLMLIHVVAVTYSQWFIATNLLVYHNDIHDLANGLF